jgi:hypothetical protein
MKYEYRTKDLGEIAFFLTKKEISLKDIEKVPDKRNDVIYFNFESEKLDLIKLKESYHMGQELVEPKFFLFKQKEAKNMIYQKVQGRE